MGATENGRPRLAAWVAAAALAILLACQRAPQGDNTASPVEATAEQQLDDLLNLGLAQIKEGSFDAARQTLAEAIAKAPSDPRPIIIEETWKPSAATPSAPLST